jgi:hypothetical protein
MQLHPSPTAQTQKARVLLPKNTSFEANNGLPPKLAKIKQSTVGAATASKLTAQAMPANSLDFSAGQANHLPLNMFGNPVLTSFLNYATAQVIADASHFHSLKKFLKQAKNLGKQEKELVLSTIVLGFCLHRQQQAQQTNNHLNTYTQQVAAINFLTDEMQLRVVKHLQSLGIDFSSERSKHLNAQLFTLQTAGLCAQPLSKKLEKRLDKLAPLNFEFDWSPDEAKTIKLEQDYIDFLANFLERTS